MESFTELLHKLQEVHEREVEGWQVKVKELSNKKGCETKRMEELFSRNQQMKEHHRLLTENIKTLENRLRAGLCDRCTVTQEVAKRRHQEYEASQIQSLQHISILASEMTNLKKENIQLKDEIRSLRAALSKGPSEQSSTSSTAPNGSPDPPTSGPVALVRPATRRGAKQPADGSVVVKTEAEQTSEEAEDRQSRGTNPSAGEVLKLHSAAWEAEQSVICVGEKRSQSVERHVQHASIPSQPPQKNSSSSSCGADVKPNRPVIHAPIPCHPQPNDSSAISLPWALSESSNWTMAVPETNSMVQSPSRQQLPFFPNLIPPVPQVRRYSFTPTWQKQSSPQPPTKEPTVVFKLRSLPENAENQTKPHEKKESLSCKYEKVSREGLRDTCDAPLDLSDRGKPKSSPKDETPTASPANVRQQRSLDSDKNTQIPVSSLSLVFHPSSCTTPAKLQEHEASSDHNHEAVREQEQREEVAGKADQSKEKKVPVLTLSLRPVVMLETLNSALQKQASSSSTGKSLSPPNDAASSSEEQHGDESGSEQDGSQGCKRQRLSMETETQRDSDSSNFHQERRIKITVRREERSPS